MALDSIGNIIHKEKEAKRKTKDQLSIVQLNNSTIGKDSTVDSEVNSTIDTIGEGSQATIPGYIQKRKDIEIDQYIMGLMSDGLIPQSYRRYHCKAIYTIGIERYNMIVIDVRDAVMSGKSGTSKPINNPAALLAYKVKGTLQLHAKQQWMREV